MPETVKEGVIAERLRVSKVGPGYIELNTPHRFVSVFRIAGGVDPYNDDDQTIQGKSRPIRENAIRQLEGQRGSPDTHAKGVPAQADKYVADFRKSCSGHGPGRIPQPLQRPLRGMDRGLHLEPFPLRIRDVPAFHHQPGHETRLGIHLRFLHGPRHLQEGGIPGPPSKPG